MDGWNTSFLLGNPIFSGYVSFREAYHLPIDMVATSSMCFFTSEYPDWKMKEALKLDAIGCYWPWHLRHDLSHQINRSFPTLKLSPTLQTSPSKNVGLLTHNKHLMFKISFPTQWRGTNFAIFTANSVGGLWWRAKLKVAFFFGWQISTVIEQDCDNLRDVAQVDGNYNSPPRNYRLYRLGPWIGIMVLTNDFRSASIHLIAGILKNHL